MFANYGSPRSRGGSSARRERIAGFLAGAYLCSCGWCFAQPYVEWERVIGGANDEWTASVRQTPDGGFIAGGFLMLQDILGMDALFVKLDSAGDLDPSWPMNPRTHGYFGDSFECVWAVEPTRDGGYLGVGSTTLLSFSGGDFYVIKLDAQGALDLAWVPNPRIIGGGRQDYATSVCAAEDGGYVVAGATSSFGPDTDVMLVKLTANGRLDGGWPRNPLVLAGRGLQRAASIRATSEGGYVVVGDTNTFDAEGVQVYGSAVYIAKLNGDGTLDEAWPENPKSLRVDGSSRASSVVQTNEGGFVLVGTARPPVGRPSGRREMFAAKLDCEGVLDSGWRENPRMFGLGIGDLASSLVELPDGGFIVAGCTEQSRRGPDDVFLIKLDADGELDPDWPQNPLAFGREFDDVASSIDVCADGGLIVAGKSRAPPLQAHDDAYIVKLSFGAPAFVRGDADSSGRIDLADGVSVLNWLFLGAGAPACADAADSDGSGDLRLSDAVMVFAWLFGGGDAPAAPTPSASEYLSEDCGRQPTIPGERGLGCLRSASVCH